MIAQLLLDALFVLAVSLIWFVLAWQTVLFFFGHRYYQISRRHRGSAPEPELPAVSVLVPCRNEELVIARTIKALLALDYPASRIEFLIINDGSADQTVEIVRSFEMDPRVRLLDVPSERAARGKAGALNFGLSHARFPLIAVYDADNTPESGALRRLAEELVRDPRLGGAIGIYRAINRRRNLLTRFLNIEGISFQWILQAGRCLLMRFATLPGTNYVIRRDLLDSLGGWDEAALTEDAELTLRIYRAGSQIKFVPLSVTWEQEPETLSVWLRQRNRWARGHNYLLRKHAGSLLELRPRRIGLELFYSLWLYYVFFAAIVVSDALFVLGLMGLVRISVPGPYGWVWLFAYVSFVLQIVTAIGSERGEDTAGNILLTLLMYFTYCQLWIPVVARAFWDDFIVHRPATWAKTERFETE